MIKGEPYAGLYQRVRLARALLPPAIVVVVVLFELWVWPYAELRWAFWLQLAFYGLVGPFVTWVTLDWIAEEVHKRESAERALLEANQRINAVREVMRRSLLAENLEEAMRSVASAIREALGREVALELEGFRWATPGFAAPPAQEIQLHRSGGRLLLADAADPDFLEVLAGEVDSVLEAAKARTRELLTLFEVDQALRAEANLEKLLEGLLEKIVLWADAEGGAVYLLDEEGLLHLWAQRGIDGLPQAFLPEGAWAEALEEATFVAPRRLAVPLREKTHVGLLVLQGAEAQMREKLPFLRILAGQVTLAVRNAQAYLRAEELAINEERNRIAREIHDGIAQALAFMALKLDLATRLLERDPKTALAEIQTVKDTLRQQIREVRRSIFALRPIDLERYGFLDSLRRYAVASAEQAGFRVRLELPERVNLSQASELVLFRVLQEALNNVAKHAKARTVTVRLEPVGAKGACLEVRDDGQGFDPEADRANGLGGFGLTQMRERVLARGGTFEVHSAPGTGTRVRAKLLY